MCLQECLADRSLRRHLWSAVRRRVWRTDPWQDIFVHFKLPLSSSSGHRSSAILSVGVGYELHCRNSFRSLGLYCRRVPPPLASAAGQSEFGDWRVSPGSRRLGCGQPCTLPWNIAASHEKASHHACHLRQRALRPDWQDLQWEVVARRQRMDHVSRTAIFHDTCCYWKRFDISTTCVCSTLFSVGYLKDVCDVCEIRRRLEGRSVTRILFLFLAKFSKPNFNERLFTLIT